MHRTQVAAGRHFVVQVFLVLLLGAYGWGEEPLDKAKRAIDLDRTGSLYYDLGQPHLAEPFFQQALALRQQALGPDHLAVATTLSRLGQVYEDLGKSDLAKSCFERALAIRAKMLGSEHPTVKALTKELEKIAAHLRDAESPHPASHQH